MFVELLYSVLILLSFLSCYHYCSDDCHHLYGLIAAVVNVTVSVVTCYRLLLVIVTPYAIALPFSTRPFVPLRVVPLRCCLCFLFFLFFFLMLKHFPLIDGE